MPQRFTRGILRIAAVRLGATNRARTDDAEPTVNQRHLHVPLLLLWVPLLLLTHAAHAAEVRAAVAANFAAPMTELAARFHQETGHTVVVIPGSTGKLATQIRQRAPFDVFLSADVAAPAALEAEGLTVAGTRFVYAVGRLVLWSADAKWLDAHATALREGRFAKLAIADPKLAPYGRAAKETLTHLGLWPAVARKLLTGENVQQAYQFAATGNAELAFVSRAQVTTGGVLRAGSMWLVPAELHAPVHQAAVLLKSARDRGAASAFLQFLRQPQTLDLLRQAGYEPPMGK